ncbi:unnamed protein product [Trichobilharzia regenti]|nr:unnamed protein product [Trichobilharzia regenti]
MLLEDYPQNAITEEEAELYDRQIRLWGVESQNRLKQSKILLLGMNALAAEIAKNIVLAGISSLTIIDDKQRSDAVISRTQDLNPMVKVQSAGMENNLMEKIQDHNLIILITESSSHDFKKWSDFCNIVNSMNAKTRPEIICASVTGLFGLVFLDLGIHECVS